MKKAILFISILIPNIIYSQEIKQYSGDFNDGTTQHGKATYSYYLKNDERIKQGAFSYGRDVKSDEGSLKSLISGSFKNNFKDGNWTQTINFTDWDNGTGNYVTGTVSLTSSYNNGLPNGQWIYTEISKSRIKKITSNGYIWSSYTTPVSAKANINFKNGKLSGGFSMEGFLLSDSYKATFDENGFCTKNLTVNYSPTFKTETSVDYYKNTMIKSVTRDKSTGEVKEKTVLTPEEISIIQKFSDGQIASKELRNYHLKIDTVKLITLETFEMNIFRNSFFLNEYIKGDKVFDGSFDFGGYHIYTTKYELKKLSDIEEMTIAESYMQENKDDKYNMEQALEKFENIKNEYQNNLSVEDLAKLNAKIAESQKIIEGNNVATRKQQQRKEEWGEINNFRVQGADISATQDVLKKAKDFQEKYMNYLTKNDKELMDYEHKSFTNTSDAENDKDLVAEKIKSLESAVKTKTENIEIEKENLKVTDQQKSQDDLKKQLDKNTEIIYGYTGQYGRGSKLTAVDNLYVILDVYNKVSDIKKKHLYNAYEIVKKDFEEKMKNCGTDTQKAIDTGNLFIKVCDKMISLANQDTNELEKKLKKEKDGQKIIELLGL